MREVLDGLPRDYGALEGHASLADLVMKNDRMRGIGLWLLIIALAVAIVGS
jgi:hypothetical protein